MQTSLPRQASTDSNRSEGDTMMNAQNLSVRETAGNAAKGDQIMTTRAASVSTRVWTVLSILLVAVAVQADTVSWRHASIRANNDWDFASVNWQGEDTVYADADDVVFNNDIVIDAGTVNIVSDVTPGSVTFFGQRNSSWTITGADILGGTSISVGLNRAVNFTGGDANADYSFTGGATASAARITYSPAAGGTTAHTFGTNDITIDNGGFFAFSPADPGDTLTNNFIVGSGGATWDDRDTGTTAVMNGTVTMNGNISMTYGAVDKYFEQDITMTGNRSFVTAGRWHHIASANINGGGIYDLTVQNGGTNPDWATYLEGSGGWNIKDFIKESNAVNRANLYIPDVAPNTFFSGVTGSVIHRGGGIQFNSSTVDVGFSLVMEVSPRDGTTTLGTRLSNVSTLNVQAGGSIGGDAPYANNYTGDITVNVADGGAVAPGLSIGTMPVVGSLVLSDASVLNFEFDNVSSDMIAVSGSPGNLTLDGVLNLLGSPVLGQTYTIFSYTGALTDNGLVLGNAPYGRLEVTDSGSEIQVVWIPEPGTLVLTALGGLLLVRRRSS